MRFIIFLLFSFISLYSANLIFITNSKNVNLEKLFDKYKSDIIIDGADIYIVPQECLIQRYFGGASDADLILPKSKIYYTKVATTQNIFEAKDKAAIDKEFKKHKFINILLGRSAKAFMVDKDGRNFGGASEQKINLEKQIQKEKHFYQNVPEADISKNHLTCKILNNGSGYQISGVIEMSIYTKAGIKLINNSIVHFK